MRYLATLAVLIIMQIGAAWAIGDANTARPGGAFSTVTAETAAQCERLCADDTLCMAWSFQANSCELKAIVPAATEREGVISGVSARAPAAMRVRFEPSPPAAIEPLLVAHEADDPPPLDLTSHEDAALALLGGPDTNEDLRGVLGN